MGQQKQELLQRHYVADSRDTIWQTADLLYGRQQIYCVADTAESRQHVKCYLCLGMLVLLLERPLFLCSPAKECIMCLSCSACREFGFTVAINGIVYCPCVHTSKQATCTAKMDVQFSSS